MPIAPLPWLTPAVAPGSIQMWSGTIATIPDGWLICDGLNGTPNLLDKFIQSVASAVTEPGGVGGATTVTLTSATMPAHNHTITTYTHQHTAPGGGPGSGGSRITNTGEISPNTGQYNTSSTKPPNQNLIATGSNGPHDNIPPFYQIAYIIKQ